MKGKKIKVLVVDDSAVVRKVLREILSRERDIEVVGTAADPYAARNKIIKLKPDVLTLDIEMPRMDGLSFLKKLIRSYPLPVVIVSSFAEKGSTLAVEALSLGAMEVMAKPSGAYTIEEMSVQLVDKIRALARAKVQPRERKRVREDVRQKTLPKPLQKPPKKIIAIGASTGGTEALKVVLGGMPPNAPAILVVQHMPAQFTASFAERLNDLSPMNIKEAKDGDSLDNGTAFVAPGDYHMLLKRSDGNYRIRIKKGALVNHQRPSADVLFHSVANEAGSNAVGALLTGMGSDGALGLLKMKGAGARTLVQDEESCVVFGMPKKAIKLGAAEKVVPLEHIARAALDLIIEERT